MILALALYALGAAGSELRHSDEACAPLRSDCPWSEESWSQCFNGGELGDDCSLLQISLHMAPGDIRGQQQKTVMEPNASALTKGTEAVRLLMPGDMVAARRAEISSLDHGLPVIQPDLPRVLTSEVAVPFAVIKAHNYLAQNTTTVEVHIATPSQILCVFAFLYLPLSIVWAVFLYKGSPERWYLVLLPFTLCTMSVGMQMVNQSLAALMDAPASIIFIQAACLCFVAGIWSLGSELRRPSLGRQLSFAMVLWASAAVMYALHEWLGRLVAHRASVCERSLFVQLCPVLSHLVEEVGVPRGKNGGRSLIGARLALAAFVSGAVLFSLQMPDMTFEGIAWVCILAAQAAPFRLLQRWLLLKWQDLPIPVLACYDAAVLLASAAGVSASSQQEHTWESWQYWVSNDSIMCMLVLSVVTFSGHHICELALLRMTTASATLVFGNLSSVVLVAVAMVFFGEHAWSSHCAVIGMLVTLAGSLWYVTEMTPARAEVAGALPSGSPRAARSLQVRVRSESESSSLCSGVQKG